MKAGLLGTIAVRDSKNPDGPALAFGQREFRTLLTRVKADTLRH